jgi:hypothetical protein
VHDITTLFLFLGAFCGAIDAVFSGSIFMMSDGTLFWGDFVKGMTRREKLDGWMIDVQTGRVIVFAIELGMECYFSAPHAIFSGREVKVKVKD